MRYIFHAPNQVFLTELTAETTVQLLTTRTLHWFQEVIIFHSVLLFFLVYWAIKYQTILSQLLSWKYILENYHYTCLCFTHLPRHLLLIKGYYTRWLLRRCWHQTSVFRLCPTTLTSLLLIFTSLWQTGIDQIRWVYYPQIFLIEMPSHFERKKTNPKVLNPSC